MAVPDDATAMISNVLQVAIGGAVGASARYLAGVAVGRTLGPGTAAWGTLGVNVIGSFLMGMFVVLAAQRSLASISPFAMTGLLGGFTTFSAFSLDAVSLIEKGQLGGAAAYVLVSVTGSIGALFAGLSLARVIWS